MVKFFAKIHSIFNLFIQTIRTEKYRRILGSVGLGTHIREGFKYFSGENIYIGSNSFVGHDVDIIATGSKVVIGDYCLIAEHVFITTETHGMKRNKKPMRLQSSTYLLYAAS